MVEVEREERMFPEGDLWQKDTSKDARTKRGGLQHSRETCYDVGLETLTQSKTGGPAGSARVEDAENSIGSDQG